MAGRLTGHRALVTGGAGGIGRTIALTLAGEGASVGISYRTSAAASKRVVAGIRAAGVRASAIRADVTREADVKRLIAGTAKALGGLDILVNNVGTFLVKDVASMTLAEWRYLLDSNVTAAFLCSKHALPFLRRARGGRIVSLGAAGAYRAHGSRGMAGFYAGKAGIVALSKSLAREVGRFGVTVNVVSPGIVADYDLTIAQARKRKDPETAIGRPGTVQDIANAVAFLCSDEAEFVTGDVLNVTGGWLL
ncbi:MAG TPA: SDR family oxidoreductase [Thermoplasmata archaeon]|nr:SDR family oxidoreductase [Thermoplasmata archaeon]